MTLYFGSIEWPMGIHIHTHEPDQAIKQPLGDRRLSILPVYYD